MFSCRKNLVFVLDQETKYGATVHMFFVFFPIDVYWLDKNKNIVDKYLSLKPFQIAVPKKKAKYVVEIAKK